MGELRVIVQIVRCLETASCRARYWWSLGGNNAIARTEIKHDVAFGGRRLVVSNEDQHALEQRMLPQAQHGQSGGLGIAMRRR